MTVLDMMVLFSSMRMAGWAAPVLIRPACMSTVFRLFERSRLSQVTPDNLPETAQVEIDWEASVDDA